MKLGIMGAMPEEIDLIVSNLEEKDYVEVGGRFFYLGTFMGIKVVVAFSRWGKVASATTATIMKEHFNINKLVFVGMAGAIVPDVNIGDIVVAQRLYQHDMDTRPLFKRFEIPLTGITSFEVGDSELKLGTDAIHDFLKTEKDFRKKLFENKIVAPTLHLGDIASGDLFVGTKEKKEVLCRNLPSVLCVEMEGAAVAQVCFDYQIPFVVIRVISDSLEGRSVEEFVEFKDRLAAHYGFLIIKHFCQILSTQILNND